jgi:hypothetical protein
MMTGESGGVLDETADKDGARSERAWATQPFKDLLEQVERLNQLLHLSARGISVLQAMPGLVKAIADIEETHEDSTTQEAMEQSRREADLARREIAEGFPLLHANHALALWSCLEATIRSFIALWLENKKDALQADAVQKLRVRIGEYEPLKGEERFFYILDRLEQESSAPLRGGINRFETILEPFGLSGSVDETVQRNLFELSSVRNCIMHRGGKADRRLIEACPWLGLLAGQSIIINSQATNRYVRSVMNYVTELLARVGEHFGKDMSKVRQRNRYRDLA